MNVIPSNASLDEIQDVINALQSQRITLPINSWGMSKLFDGCHKSGWHSFLNELAALGFTSPQVISLLEMVKAERFRRCDIEELVDLVTTGPDTVGINSRDTSVVVRDLFTNATQAVMVVGYAVYQGQQVFQTLADRMHLLPSLQVRLFLDARGGNDLEGNPDSILKHFALNFRTNQWPQGRPLPEVYYDPRSLDDYSTARSSLHAKCIVVDHHKLFVSSANFTVAAQKRNIEVGLLVKSEPIARRLERHFETLCDSNHLRRVSF
ncbi:MAG: phospholipase [Planctomycetia bacterium]|nr:phospholipase [Planctomycetia bacterium]